MAPTDNSMLNPSRGGITIPNRMIAAPTTKIVNVCPVPQNTPIHAAFEILRSRLTMVVTAITWSGSVAWRMPRKNPRAMMERKAIRVFNAATSQSQIACDILRNRTKPVAPDFRRSLFYSSSRNCSRGEKGARTTMPGQSADIRSRAPLPLWPCEFPKAGIRAIRREYRFHQENPVRGVMLI